MSFGKKRSEVPQSSNTGLSFKGLFSGTALVTPVIFNPNAEQIRAIKNIKPEFEVKEPEYIIKSPVKDENGDVIPDKTQSFRKVSLMFTFDPNAMLKLKAENKKYADKFFSNFEFKISNRLTINKAGTKLMVIDGKLNQFWIDINAEKLQEMYKEYRGKTGNKEEQLEDILAFVRKAAKKAQDTPRATRSPLDDLDLKTVRFCREGEQILYKLIFNMSDMYIPKKLSSDDAKKMKKENEKKYEEYMATYEETDMTFISSMFDDLMSENYENLNDMIFNTKKEFFEQDGYPCKLGVFLGVRAGNDGKFYQGCFTPAHIYGDNYTFRLPYKTALPKAVDGASAYGVTLMPKKMAHDVAGITSNGSQGYAYRDIWQDSFEFKEFTPEDAIPETVVETSKAEEIDDLPF